MDTKELLEQWGKLNSQYENGYHLSDHDKHELVRLNHLLMEKVHKIHNDNMLQGIK